MRINIGQIVLLSLVIFLLFGDINSLKKKFKTFPEKIEIFLREKNSKKKRI